MILNSHHGDNVKTTPDVYRPKIDVYSADTKYKVYISLPSADKETTELIYDPNTRELVVSRTLVRPVEFADLDEEELKNVLVVRERKAGKYERKSKIQALGFVLRKLLQNSTIAFWSCLCPRLQRRVQRLLLLIRARGG